eukprot:TRINITY_DN895_c0_g2_i1.p1 TRINITY_DN895_c0_g2~~TRINITY_DN895_c0_g2_i1.p1  ORF type:complete len:218 (+),score=81.58 TRINITY_DN895_c0_g2_i1:60-713(+)
MAPKIKLSYFDIQGVAEKVRLALILNGVEFEDDRFGFDEWAERKKQTPHGQVPVMTIDGELHTQSGAMLRLAGQLGAGKLYPKDPMEALMVDEVIGLSEDFQRAWDPGFYAGIKPSHIGHDVEGDEKVALMKKLREKFCADDLPTWLGRLAGKVEGKRFFCGDQPTIADCLIYPQLVRFRCGGLDYVPTDCLSKFPPLVEWMARFEDIPEVKAWYAK